MTVTMIVDPHVRGDWELRFSPDGAITIRYSGLEWPGTAQSAERAAAGVAEFVSAMRAAVHSPALSLWLTDRCVRLERELHDCRAALHISESQRKSLGAQAGAERVA